MERRNEKSRTTLTEKIATMKPVETGRSIRKLFRLTKSPRERKQRKRLVPDSFTGHMTADAGLEARIEQLPFEVDQEFEILMKKAISRAPKKKAAGVEGIFVEALQCASKEMASLLTTIWRKGS